MEGFAGIGLPKQRLCVDYCLKLNSLVLNQLFQALVQIAIQLSKVHIRVQLNDQVATFSCNVE